MWAIRRIGELIDEIDLNGTNRELTDELVQLSLKHGILTPYTSFLADEHVDLADQNNLGRRTRQSLDQLQRTEGSAGFVQRDFKSKAKAASGATTFANGGQVELQAAAPPGSDKSSQAGPGVFINGSVNGNGTIVGMDSPHLAEGFKKLHARNGQPVQTIAGKTFYWKDNRWRDADLTKETETNPIRVAQFTDAYFALAARDNGRFSKYLALEGPILVRLDDKTYLIEAAETK